MLKVRNVSKSYGPYTALTNISFNLGKDQKAALVGPNGVGKSTLLRIISGEESPDSGTVGVPKRSKIGYLPQEVAIDGDETIEQYLKRITEIFKIEKHIRELEPHLSDPQNLEEYGGLQEKYLKMGGYNFNTRISLFLSAFGLDDVGVRAPLHTMSGGQKTKVALTGLLLVEPDILILDEPTNNLDLPALIWLEEFLRKSKSAMLIVSHDKKFLDTVVSKVFEINWENHSLSEFPGTYSEFLRFKEKELRRIKDEYERQQKKIRELKEAARRQKQWAQKGAFQTVPDKDKALQGFRRNRATKASSRAKSIEKRIEQARRIEKPRERKPLSIPLNVQRPGTGQIELKGVVVNYPESDFRLGPINLTIPYGARVVILGANGSGKSTLLNAISGATEVTEGGIRVSPSLRIGSLMQFHENLPLEETVMDFLTVEGRVEQQECYKILTRFGLEPTKVSQNIQMLSPGERARVVLALLAARSVNVLLLDEPTNHLDIEATEALEEVLSNYKGTVVAVSHDRNLLEQIKPQILYLVQEGKLKQLPNLASYVNRIQKDVRRILRLLT
ncbi:MAG: ABC-F family ATP-binding cassette domain-containing protein [Patescibacteria group bacterium]|nr:MAG: ABC-F family ATP-binding cassette domain-containing protein [Patescibacteria group bacterium]